MYTACQTHLVDGTDCPFPTFDAFKLYEVQKYIMLTGHIHQWQVVTMNLAFWRSLSPDQQKAIETAVEGAGIYATDLGLAAEKADAMKLQAMTGTQVVTDIDLPAFIARARKLAPKISY